MVNNWGCNLVNTTGGCSFTFHELDGHVRSNVPGFHLFSLEVSGTSSNETAIGEATNYDPTKCIYAMGSYAGGSGKMEKMSTTSYLTQQKSLSVPVFPADSTEEAKLQTVAFPYWIECAQLAEKERTEIETKCLYALQKRILIRLMVGEPYKAILFELILGGNGGELSNSFLRKLGCLMSKYGITIIVDEVMTGGRVGPSMTMTSSCPKDFRDKVGFVTMGKVFNCGVVLRKVPKTPIVSNNTRGNSTHLDAGEACMKWKEIQDRLDRGFPEQRRKQVLTLMKTLEREDCWGKGCLIFTSKSRPSVSKGLKQRLLPMLENKKLRKNATKQSEWNRSSVCNVLKNRAIQWLEHMDECNRQQWPFTTAIVESILNPATTEITPDGIEAALGPDKANAMAEDVRSKILSSISCRNGKCDKRAKTFIRDAIATATQNCPDLIKRVRVGKKRKLIYRINREALHFDSNIYL